MSEVKKVNGLHIEREEINRLRFLPKPECARSDAVMESMYENVNRT